MLNGSALVLLRIAHASVERDDDAIPLYRLGNRFQRRYRDDRQRKAERQALGDATGNAQTGKRSGSRSESDGVERMPFDASLAQHFGDKRQQQFRMALAGEAITRNNVLAVLQGDGQVFSGSFQREDLHAGGDFTASVMGGTCGLCRGLAGQR